MNRRWMVLAAALLVLLGAGWGFHHFFTLVKEPAWQGYQGEAARNDFLAAQRLAQRLGFPATSVRGLPSPLPPVNESLVLPRRRLAMPEAEAQALADWVGQGGHLLAAGGEPEAEDAPRAADPLFRAFGARLVEVARPEAADDLLLLSVDGHDRTLGLRRDLALQDDSGKAVGKASTADGCKALQYDHGKGRCTLLPRLDLMDNDHLGEHDHARFFADVALLRTTTQTPCRVWIVAWEQPRSAWGWLLAAGGPLVVSLAALAGALVWARAPRFGPVAGDPPVGRRRFMEHLDAAGRLHWRRSEGRPLLAACREAFLRRLAVVHPAWIHMDPDRQCARLAEHAGLPEERVFRALRYDLAADAQGLLEAIQTLEILRKRL